MRTAVISIDVEEDLRQDSEKTFHGVTNTEQIIELLNSHDIHCTAFVTGEVLSKFSKQLKTWSAEHEIACHNYKHIPLSELNSQQRALQLSSFCKLFKRKFGTKPCGFRAVQNVIDSEQMALLEREGFRYDSSIVSNYPLFRRYVGYNGRSPSEPYHPDIKDIRKHGEMKLLEIPLSPLAFGFPLNGTWMRLIPNSFYKMLFMIKKPKFLSLTMHSWDSVNLNQKYYKNSGGSFLRILDKCLNELKKSYTFKTCSEVWREFGT